jgi:hypothetical protein
MPFDSRYPSRCISDLDPGVLFFWANMFLAELRIQIGSGFENLNIYGF